MNGKIIEMLQDRGVTMECIARLVLELQRPYNLNLPWKNVWSASKSWKAGSQHAVLTGLTLDIYAEKACCRRCWAFSPDDHLYGIDEILA